MRERRRILDKGNHKAKGQMWELKEILGGRVDQSGFVLRNSGDYIERYPVEGSFLLLREEP